MTSVERLILANQGTIMVNLALLGTGTPQNRLDAVSQLTKQAQIIYNLLQKEVSING